jgi:serine/threonine protein kinase
MLRSMPNNCTGEVELFTEAINLPTEERISFLDRECAGNQDLRRRIEKLLRDHDRAGEFMEAPLPGSIHELRTKISAGEKPGDRIGRYKLLQQIGEGGCGIVFVAEQQEPVRRRVALKVIKPGMDTRSVIARFEVERQALALMDHSSIARVLDAGAAENGRPYFVMELVDGVKITDYCDQHALPNSHRLELFVQVCLAIQHAHQKGIIHRDIKPSNILVARGPDGKPVPKVIDFGIAKAIDGQRLTEKTIFTAAELVIGTPAYMSPEQAALQTTDVDTRTDIYSLGVLLYELLTGTTPFDTRELLKAGLDELRRVIREQQPVRPSTRLSTMVDAVRSSIATHHGAEAPGLIREMRGELDWIVMKALEKNRARRYATANGLAMDIQRYLSGEVVLARPPSAVYKLQKLLKRNRLLFIGLGLIFLLLIIALAVTGQLVLTQRRQVMSAAAIQLEVKALSYLRDSNPDAAVATLRESFAIRRRYLNGQPPSMAAEFVLDGLVGMHKISQTEALLDEMLTPVVLARPESSELILFRAELCAQDGKWQSAVSDAMRLVKMEPENSSRYHLLAPLLVATTNLSTYQNLCQKILERFSNTTNVTVADQMAKDCLILRSAGVDLKTVAAMSGLAVTNGKAYGAYHFFQCCEGLAQYRLGNYQEAAKWAEAAVKTAFPHSQGEAYAVLAMAQYKLGNENLARETLTNCNYVIERGLAKPGEWLGQDWKDWIIAHALESEAKQTIDGEALPQRAQ